MSGYFCVNVIVSAYYILVYRLILPEQIYVSRNEVTVDSSYSKIEIICIVFIVVILICSDCYA